MSTSGSVNYNDTRSTIITDALYEIGALGIGETLSSEDEALANRYLNRMIKSYPWNSLHLFGQTEGTLFLQADQVKYNLGATDHASNTTVETTTSAAAISGASTVTCTTVTGMTASDNIGIELDDGTIQWTTISSINSGTKVVTLATTLTDAVASGNVIYTYTTRLNRPLMISNVRRRDVDGIDIPLTPLSRQEYMDLPNKTSEGTPNSYFYDPQLTYGYLYVWQEPDDMSIRLKFTYDRPLEDFDNSSDNPDFPQEWLLPIVRNLAVLIAPDFSRPVSPDLARQAQQGFQMAWLFDTENTSVYLAPRSE
jgi:hypothetical protein